MIGKIPFILITLIIGSMMLISCGSEKGIKTVQLHVDSDPTISFRIWFQVGSQNDPEGKEGLALLTASMLTEGSTEQNSYDQILQKLYPMAADYTASVDKEMTVIIGRVHQDNADDYLNLLTEAILHPAFLPEDFNRIQSNTINYLEKTLRYSNDEAFGKEALYRMVFEETPYEHPIEGYIESVRSITLEHIKQFYDAYYTRDNVVIGIGGDYDKALVGQLKTDLETLPPSVTTPVEKPELKPVEDIDVLLVEKDTESTAISIGFPIDALRGDRDFYALWIANSWFGEHRNSASHLFQIIRETRGMNYGDYSYIEHFPDGWAHQFPAPNVGRRQQIFEIWIRPVQNDAAHFALRAAIRELQKLVDNGMTKEDFELTKKFLKKYQLHYAPTTSERLGYKIDDLFYGIEDHLKTLPKMLDKLTLEEVNNAIQRHLQYENMKIAMITKNAKSLKKALTDDDPSPMEYATPKPPEVLEEDQKIEKYALDIKPENVKIVDVDEMFVR
ncbi:insulinase family protein [bacterium]|nr:insulinase family protein [bacterium]RQV96734.1 MAG: insulinase family protein [bacterium]